MATSTAVLIAGPNGAGKTTFARQVELGFRTVLHFIELPSADFAVARVRARVAAGGHDIPEDDVRRRFDRGRRLFTRYTRMHSTSRTIGSVMKKASDWSASIPVSEVEELDLLLEAARRATWDAKHGPKHLRSGGFFMRQT